MCLASSRSADQNAITLLLKEAARGEIAHQPFIDRRAFEGEVVDVLGQRKFGDRHLIFDKPLVFRRFHAAPGRTLGKPLAMAFETGFASEIRSGRQLALLVGNRNNAREESDRVVRDREMSIDARARKLAAFDQIGLRRETALPGL